MNSKEQQIHDAIFLVVKHAFDCNLNPYFNFSGNHFDMPEAIDYMLRVAPKEIEACGDADAWANARIAEIADVPFEEDSNIAPDAAHAHGFEPRQLVYIKGAHEYYLAHVCFCGHPCKTFPELQRTHFDIEKIFRLARQYPKSFWQSCSFEDAHYKGQEDAFPLLGRASS